MILINKIPNTCLQPVKHKSVMHNINIKISKPENPKRTTQMCYSKVPNGGPRYPSQNIFQASSHGACGITGHWNGGMPVCWHRDGAWSLLWAWILSQEWAQARSLVQRWILACALGWNKARCFSILWGMHGAATTFSKPGGVASPWSLGTKQAVVFKTRRRG